MIQYILRFKYLSEYEERIYERAIKEAQRAANKHGYIYQGYGGHKEKVHSATFPIKTPSKGQKKACTVFSCDYGVPSGRVSLLGVDIEGLSRSRRNRKRIEIEDFARRTLLHAKQDPRLSNSGEGVVEDGVVAVHPRAEQIRRVQFTGEQQGEGNLRVQEWIQPSLPFEGKFREARITSGIHGAEFMLHTPETAAPERK